MRISDVARRAFGIGGAVVLLSGCGGSQSTIGAPGAIPQVPSNGRDSRHSWMRPEAKNTDLLYVDSGESSNDVEIYTFPKATHVGELTGLPWASGMCTDQVGNVWIVNYESGGPIVEYAHGGTEQIATLKTSETLTPQDCSVDPTTGNLAVVGFGHPRKDVKGRVLVYPRATGLPTTYRVSFATTRYCAYDNDGNLLVDGQGLNHPFFAAAELQKGAQRFSNISFEGSAAPSYQPTPVQWDGTYFAIGIPPDGINRYAISNLIAEQKGSMTTDQSEPYDFWIQGELR
ncbi:MAG: hypothetical protein WAL67_05400 [Candidatus Cybelea sp.]